MTEPTNTVAALFADHKRAAAIITHHARGDTEGVLSVLNEAAEERRCAELVAAILHTYRLVVPHISDDDTLTRIQQLAATWAARAEEHNQ